MPLGAFESWCLKYLEDTNTFYLCSVSVDLFPSGFNSKLNYLEPSEDISFPSEKVRILEYQMIFFKIHLHTRRVFMCTMEPTVSLYLKKKKDWRKIYAWMKFLKNFITSKR